MSGFAASIASWTKAESARVERFRRVMVVGLFSRVIMDTPVLSGRLRGNWQTSVGAPITGELPLRQAAEAVADVERAVDSIAGKDATVFFRNNLPYAERIEYEGWSHTKAPAGMVRKNVLLWSQNARKALSGGNS